MPIKFYDIRKNLIYHVQFISHKTYVIYIKTYGPYDMGFLYRYMSKRSNTTFFISFFYILPFLSIFLNQRCIFIRIFKVFWEFSITSPFLLHFQSQIVNKKKHKFRKKDAKKVVFLFYSNNKMVSTLHILHK